MPRTQQIRQHQVVKMVSQLKTTVRIPARNLNAEFRFILVPGLWIALVTALVLLVVADGVAAGQAGRSRRTSDYVPRLFGVCGTNSPLPLGSDFLETISRGGVKWFRTSQLLPIGSNQTPTNNVSNIEKAGMSQLALLMGSGAAQNLTVPQWQAQITLIVENNPQIHAWEFGNEPNSSQFGSWSSSQFYNYMSTGIQAIHTMAGHESDLIVGPAVTIWTYGSSPLNDQSIIDWVKSFIDLGGAQLIDYADLHLYLSGSGTGINPGTLATQAQIQAGQDGLDYYESLFGGKPMIITETGFRNDDDAIQAQALSYLYSMYLAKSYICGVFWYNSAGPGWGLFMNTSSPSPRESWTTLEQIIARSIPSIRSTRDRDCQRWLDHPLHVGGKGGSSGRR